MDYNKFKSMPSKFNQGLSGRIGNDLSTCQNLQTTDIASVKKLKYLTSNFFENSDTIQNPGIFMTKQYGVPACSIDLDTRATRPTVTKFRGKYALGELPLLTTPGYTGGQGDVDMENNMRGLVTLNRKSCLPTETKFYNRVYQPFDNMPIVPMACVDNYVMPNRVGVYTRRMKMVKPGKKCKSC